MQLDITQESTIQRLIIDIESTENKQRRIDEMKAYKCAEGGQKEYVVQEIQKLFPESWSTMRISDISLTKKILDKIPAYKESPIRKLSTDEKTAEYNELLSVADAHTSFQEFDRDFNRQKYGLMWVKRFEDKRYKLESLKGFESFVVIDKNTGDLIGVVLNYPDKTITRTSTSTSDGRNQIISESQDDSAESSKVYVFWTKDHHTIWRAVKNKEEGWTRVEYIENPENPNDVNVIGTLPFVWRAKNQSGDLPYLSPLTENSILTNILISDYITGAALQTHGQLVVKMSPQIKVSKIHTGQSTAINLPIIEGAEVQADAYYINANPDLAGMKDAIMTYASMVIGTELGDTGSIAAGNETFSSGIERLISQAGTQNIISQNQNTYVGIEKDVFEIIAKYESIEGNNSFIDEDLSIYFPKPKVMITDRETLENIEKQLSLGLITKVEALQMIDPNLTEDQATMKLEKIELEKLTNMESFINGGQNFQEADTAEAE